MNAGPENSTSTTVVMYVLILMGLLLALFGLAVGAYVKRRKTYGQRERAFLVRSTILQGGLFIGFGIALRLVPAGYGYHVWIGFMVLNTLYMILCNHRQAAISAQESIQKREGL